MSTNKITLNSSFSIDKIFDPQETEDSISKMRFRGFHFCKSDYKISGIPYSYVFLWRCVEEVHTVRISALFVKIIRIEMISSNQRFRGKAHIV